MSVITVVADAPVTNADPAVAALGMTGAEAPVLWGLSLLPATITACAFTKQDPAGKYVTFTLTLDVPDAPEGMPERHRGRFDYVPIFTHQSVAPALVYVDQITLTEARI